MGSRLGSFWGVLGVFGVSWYVLRGCVFFKVFVKIVEVFCVFEGFRTGRGVGLGVLPAFLLFSKMLLDVFEDACLEKLGALEGICLRF